jgi:hypothetical protein
LSLEEPTFIRHIVMGQDVPKADLPEPAWASGTAKPAK